MSERNGGTRLDLERFHRTLLETAGVGLAILEPDTFRILFHNPRLGEWVPVLEDQGVGIGDLFPDLDLERVRERLEDRGRWTGEAEIRVKRRAAVIALRISRPGQGELPLLVLEATNVTKIKELEYMIESYSKMVEKQNRKLQKEKERVERLLLNIMPRKVYEEIQEFGVTTPQRFEEASVLMLDFVDFTEMTVSHDPSALIAELNDIFTSFDQIAEQFGCERIKTIGDAYMAVCGIPEPNPEHAQTIAKVALLFVRYLERRNVSHSHRWRCRVGINSGPVIGSIVGVQRYVYDIFGPGVNLATRLETMSGPMEITLCEEMQERLKPDFRFEERGEAEIKGFGTRRIFRLVGERRPAGAGFPFPV